MLESVGVSADMADHVETAIGPGHGGQDGLALDEDIDGDLQQYMKSTSEIGGMC